MPRYRSYSSSGGSRKRRKRCIWPISRRKHGRCPPKMRDDMWRRWGGDERRDEKRKTRRKRRDY